MSRKRLYPLLNPTNLLPMTPIKIVSIWVLTVVLILWIFWYYIHNLSGTVTSGSWAFKTISSDVKKTEESTTKIPPVPITPLNTTNTINDVDPGDEWESTDDDSVSDQESTVDTTHTIDSNTIQKSSTSTTPASASETAIMNSSKSSDEPTKTVASASYSVLWQVFSDKSWNGSQSNYTNYWGSENVSQIAGSMRVFYPKGSNAPSNSPRGWAGFIYNFPAAHEQLSLSYTIKFEEGFDFVKGWKLPGLCGGNCSRGSSMPTDKGFSIRFVWKKNGYLDIMTFLPNTVKLGNYAGEKMFQFEPGKEYILTQQIKMNDIGKENGIIRILVDGKTVYEKTNVTLRVAPDVQINSFLFSTFFWGKDDTYSSSKDTYVYFGKFKVWTF